MERTLALLMEDVARLVAPTSEQLEWAATGGHVPAEEIALSLYDAVDVFCPWLREQELIDDDDYRLLRGLVAYLEAVQPKLFVGDGVTDADEWRDVRERAAVTLASLRRHAT